jgi:hypothetical protein
MKVIEAKTVELGRKTYTTPYIYSLMEIEDRSGDIVSIQLQDVPDSVEWVSINVGGMEIHRFNRSCIIDERNLLERTHPIFASKLVYNKIRVKVHYYRDSVEYEPIEKEKIREPYEICGCTCGTVDDDAAETQTIEYVYRVSTLPVPRVLVGIVPPLYPSFNTFNVPFWEAYMVDADTIPNGIVAGRVHCAPFEKPTTMIVKANGEGGSEPFKVYALNYLKYISNMGGKMIYYDMPTLGFDIEDFQNENFPALKP